MIDDGSESSKVVYVGVTQNYGVKRMYAVSPQPMQNAVAGRPSIDQPSFPVGEFNQCSAALTNVWEGDLQVGWAVEIGECRQGAS
jgi:hypothetical protein